MPSNMSPTNAPSLSTMGEPEFPPMMSHVHTKREPEHERGIGVDGLPVHCKPGLAYRFKYYGTSRMTLALDGVKPSDETAYGALGLECEVGDYAVARVGYSTRHAIGNGFGRR